MVRRVIPLVVLLALVLSVPALAAEPGKGVVEGRLVNGTKDGGKITGIGVTLLVYQGLNKVGSQTTTAGADGRFTFSGLDTDPGYLYQATAAFLDSEYYSEPFKFDGQESTRSIEITVYETTTSDEAVRIGVAHTVIYPVADGTQVERYYLVLNDGDRSFVGAKDSRLPGKKETLRFTLPAGAVDPEYLLGLSSASVVPAAGGFADTAPVTPGGREVAYSYRIPTGPAGFTLAEKLEYATTRFEVLVGGEGIECRSDQLAAKGKRDVRGVPFQQFSGGNFDRGQTVSIQLTGLPHSSRPGFLTWTAAALAALATLLGIVYIAKRRRPATAESGPDDTRERLLSQMAQLDDDFSSGAMSEGVYQRLRAEKKAQLVEMSKRSGRQ